jgi:hypothetical protein
MASITDGSTSVNLGGLFGPVLPSAIISVEITRGGIAGKAYKNHAYHGMPWNARSWATASNLSNKNLTHLAYMALKSQVVTLTDDTSTAWSYIFVRDVQIVRAYPVTNASSGAGYIVESVWELESVATSY